MSAEDSPRPLVGVPPTQAEIAAVITSQTGYVATPEELRILAARLEFVQPQLDRMRAETLGDKEPWHLAAADLERRSAR